MRLLPVTSLALGILLTGCATSTAPREALAASSRTILVSGFEPTVYGVNVGTTVFQNAEWHAVPEGFHPNQIATTAANRALTRPLPVIDGPAAGISIIEHPEPTREVSEAELARELGDLGRAQNAGRIIFLTTGTARDWIAGTNQSLGGIGLYRRELFGMRRFQAYGVFRLEVFDCQTKKFVASETLPAAQEVYALEWHESWAAFPPAQQNRIVAAWTSLLQEQTAQLLTRAGFANAPLREESTVKKLLLMPNRPKSWVPEGNVLPLPAGTTRVAARLAIVDGLKAREWELVSENGDEIVGRHRDGKKEAGVVVHISSEEITLRAADHEIKNDGSRMPASYSRWHNNLKESIYQNLLNGEAATD